MIIIFVSNRWTHPAEDHDTKQTTYTNLDHTRSMPLYTSINNSGVREFIYFIEFDDDYDATIYRSALRNGDRRTHYALCIKPKLVHNIACMCARGWREGERMSPQKARTKYSAITLYSIRYYEKNEL